MASRALRWYSSSSATVELFIAHGHADAVLTEACLMRLTMLMLLAVVGGWATMLTPCVVGVVAQWQYVVQLDWSECSVEEFVRTSVLIFAATGLNLLLWPTPNVHLRAHSRAGFTEALALACAAHGAQHPSVQYGCLLQLGAHLSRRRGGSAEHVRQAGGMAAASAALTANPTHEGIRLEGLSLLANLSCLPPPAPRDDDDDDDGDGTGGGGGGGGGRGGGTGGGGAASAKKTDARTEDDDAPDADAGDADAGAAAAIVGALAAGESCPEEAQTQGAIALANMTLVSHSVAAVAALQVRDSRIREGDTAGISCRYLAQRRASCLLLADPLLYYDPPLLRSLTLLPLQEALRRAPPAHQERLLAALEHHPVAPQAEAMKQLVGALQAINRTGAKPRTEEGYMSWTKDLPE